LALPSLGIDLGYGAAYEDDPMRFTRRLWVLLVTLPFLLGACDWTQRGFDSANTNYNPHEPALTNSSVQHLTPAWSTQDASPGVVVANGVVFTHQTTGPAPNPDKATAFDISTGTVKWATTLPHGEVPWSVGNGLVYYSQGDGGTIALDADTGVQRWSRPEFALALDGTRLFAVSDYYTAAGRSGELAAIDPSGQTLWSTTTAGGVTGGVVQDGKLIVMTFINLNNSVTGIILVSTYDEANGELLQRVAVPAKDASGNVNQPGITSLAAGRDLIYFDTAGTTGHGSNLFAVDPTSGAVAWHLTAQGITRLAITPNAVVVANNGANTNQVRALNPATGAELWTANPTGYVADPRVSGNLVFVTHLQVNPMVGMLVYDLTNGALVTSSTTVCCDPTPTNGRVIVSGNGLNALVPSQ
jgi:outer membrane protein assembly factor BamB